MHLLSTWTGPTGIVSVDCTVKYTVDYACGLPGLEKGERSNRRSVKRYHLLVGCPVDSGRVVDWQPERISVWCLVLRFHGDFM
jgi:hypothetical protein